MKRKWEPCDCCCLPSVSLPPSSRPPLPCFGSPPRTSSVFVSHCINSVMVMSGMCINSDLPCLPLSLLFLSRLSHSSLLVHVLLRSSLFPLPSHPPYLSPPLTLNPRMAPITRTCWCVRVPWEWPPVSLPLWEASPSWTRSGTGLRSTLSSWNNISNTWRLNLTSDQCPALQVMNKTWWILIHVNKPVNNTVVTLKE